MKKKLLLLFIYLLTPFLLSAQHEHHQTSSGINQTVEPQPLLAQALRLSEALNFSGNALSAPDLKRLKALNNNSTGPESVRAIQEILDPYCLNIIGINPEGRVKVDRGLAKAVLIQGGWTSFLVKINNDAGITAKLEAESPNAAKPYHSPSFEPNVKKENVVTPGQVANRFAEIQMYTNRPLQPNLSGLKLEYAVVQIYSKDAGSREIEIGYSIGHGSQDIGYRNTTPILFKVKPSVKVKFHVRDDDGSPVMASFLITDSQEHAGGKFTGIYPLPSRRVASTDKYPDFFFQPQIYRSDGEDVQLPPGKYSITFTRGPEYIKETRQVIIPENVKELDLSFQLKRWIKMSKLGWFSADHHIHAAGCSHYDSPTEGVDPKDMWRQVLGEDLNMAANLAWGPSWYHQKTFFTGKDEPYSNKKNIMRNDVEVSGFPSSHAGHIVLLRIKEDDYPGTTLIEQWPSWTAPVLSWAKNQGGVVGYAHSGWGLEPQEMVTKLPNYVIPKMDGIGANEYVVTVTNNLVDFYSLGDTPAPWELNMYYHTLNCGFKIRLSGETDFPCITDARVGQARSYFKTDGVLSYDQYAEALKKGKSYVSDGKSHIMDFAVNGQQAGSNESELSFSGKQTVKITAKVAAYVPLEQDETGKKTAATPIYKMPYWDIERARIGQSRKVKVELIVNGEAVDAKEIPANGDINDVEFSLPIQKSSWVATRIYPSSHSNPVFIYIDKKPVLEKKSAEWCLAALKQCWKMKEPNIRKEEKKDAEAAYDAAAKVYQDMINEK
ncbi:CehA/McbA family metallohydrolase [Dyadobacter subterraneus]|uniref:CehA/McbA family metallohydrolase n=1 Tax=Dyadobacter subterraneus TaxID=2773304 RepID=A0ABR9WFL0_9BACT|nr:CehA/McbA family metallohydrolase [Dyadobacter subterraneus]MBE9464285.1 CehA/McbA family metallohydrolase [Dyadobacter subterraneus]